MKKVPFPLGLTLLPLTLLAQGISREYKITNQYLNIPVEMKQERQKVWFLADDELLTHAMIRIAAGEPDYWVFKDVSAYQGKTIKLVFSNMIAGLDKIYQSDHFVGADNLYREKNRPQFHFSARRGWHNDPNGLVWFDPEYHLFFQHNPYETEWGNMHWGHAVSPDLLHWTELNDALFPDQLGTMFSGSAVIDQNNTAGWGKNTLVAAYTTDGKGEFQCIAYSHDRGRTFTKYAGNPVAGETRDPRVIWHEPTQQWVMALFYDAGIRFLTSKNLKVWTLQSYLRGFYECPELFELAVDGNPQRTLWVVYGGSGTYMLGDFDGKIFTPRNGKYRTFYGAHYAAQTFNHPPDGKRIQIGWARIESPDMPFNQMMGFPTELTLRTTNEGIRLFSEPIAAIARLHHKKHDLSGLSVTEVNDQLAAIKHDLLHVKARLESLNGGRILMHYRGNQIGQMDGDEFNEIQTPSAHPGTLVFEVELLIDRTSVESFYQRGQIVFVAALKAATKDTGLEILGDASQIKIHQLEIYELLSIW